MKLVGIVAEYNPFHNGHKYQIQQAKEKSGCDKAAIIMSGNFVQRGEVACAEKFTRAQWAIKNGADIVYELPVAYVLQGATGFALGAVSCLKNAGATHISFGSEIDDLEILKDFSGLIMNSDNNKLIKNELAKGKSYPRAVSEAFKNLKLDDYLNNPNFVLGIEYLKANKILNANLIPVVIQRKGNDYNSNNIDDFASANAIRNFMGSNENIMPLYNSICQDVFNYFKNNQMIKTEDLLQTFLFCLRSKSAEELSQIFNVDEGYENAMKTHASNTNYFDLLYALKSKRYTMAKIKRALCCMILDIDKGLIKKANTNAPYLRVLAIKQGSEHLLSLAKKNHSILICGGSDIASLDGFAKQLIQKDILATNITSLINHNFNHYNFDYTKKMIKC